MYVFSKLYMFLYIYVILLLQHKLVTVSKKKKWISMSVLKMESDNNRQLINGLKQF